MVMNWRVWLIMVADVIDDRIIGHRWYRLCCLIGQSPFWSVATPEQYARFCRIFGYSTEEEESDHE